MATAPRPAAPKESPRVKALAAARLAADKASKTRMDAQDALDKAREENCNILIFDSLKAARDAARAACDKAGAAEKKALESLRWILTPGTGKGAYTLPRLEMECYGAQYGLPRIPAALLTKWRAARANKYGTVEGAAGRDFDGGELYAAILYKGAQAGRVSVKYPRDGAGTLRLAVSFWGGPFGSLSSRGTAGGYGYDKLSAAFADALEGAGIRTGFSGCGMETVERFLKAHGYTFAF